MEYNIIYINIIKGNNMGIDVGQLREYVIQPILKSVDLHSVSAEQLLLGTAAVETACGQYIHQIGGVAYSIYQIEPFSHQDIWINYLAFRKDLGNKILYACNYVNRPPDTALIYNLAYATLIARVKYLRSPMALPEPNDVYGMSNMWKSIYNTAGGAGTESKFQDAYLRYVSPLYK
jgi:hypothetical protein